MRGLRRALITTLWGFVALAGYGCAEVLGLDQGVPWLDVSSDAGTEAGDEGGSGGLAGVECTTSAQCTARYPCEVAACIEGQCVVEPVCVAESPHCEAQCNPSGDAVECVAVAPDRDGDSHGDALCPATLGNAGDCDDTNDAVHPGAAEICNDRDDDCDGQSDIDDLGLSGDIRVLASVQDPEGTDIYDGPGMVWSARARAFASVWTVGNLMRRHYFNFLETDGLKRLTDDQLVAEFAADEGSPATIAANAEQVAIAWSQVVSPGDVAVYVKIYDGSSGASQPALRVDTPASPANAANGYYYPVVVALPYSAWAVFWVGNTPAAPEQIWAASIWRGSVASTVAIADPGGDRGNLDAAFTADRIAVVWENRRDVAGIEWTMLDTRLDHVLPQRQQRVSPSGSEATHPVVGAYGDGFVVAWNQIASGADFPDALQVTRRSIVGASVCGPVSSLTLAPTAISIDEARVVIAGVALRAPLPDVPALVTLDHACRTTSGVIALDPDPQRYTHVLAGPEMANFDGGYATLWADEFPDDLLEFRSIGPRLCD